MKKTLRVVVALLFCLGSTASWAEESPLKDKLWNALIAVPTPVPRTTGESKFDHGERLNKARELKLLEIIRGPDGSSGLFSTELAAQKLSLHEHRVLRHGRIGSATELSVRNIALKLGAGNDKPTIVLGAHLDKVPEAGSGIIDDWSGSVMILHALKQLLSRTTSLKHNFVVVCFAYEESGLWGSQTFVNDLKNGEEIPAQLIGNLDNVDAMVNIECLGVSQLYGWKEGSTPELTDLATEVGNDLSIPFTNRLINLPVGADSVPFFTEGVRAITIDSLIAPADFPLIHSPEDKLETILGRAGKDGYLKSLDFVSEYLFQLDQKLSIDRDQPGFVNARRQRRKHQADSRITFATYGEAFHQSQDDHATLQSSFQDGLSEGTDRLGQAGMSHAVRITDEGLFAFRDATGWTLLAFKNGKLRRKPLGDIPTDEAGIDIYPKPSTK